MTCRQAYLIEAGLKKRRKKVDNCWRMDETYIKVKGEWMGSVESANICLNLIGGNEKPD